MAADAARFVRLAVAVVCAAAAACAPSTELTLPTGTAVPSADAVPLYERAAAGCRAIDAATAEVSVSGRLGRERVRGRLLVGLDRDGRLRVEALAPFGEPVFVLAAEGGTATLLLPRQRRVLSGAPTADVLDALAGLRLDAPELHALLLGCLASGEAHDGEGIGRFASVRLGAGARAFVTGPADAPRVVSGEIAAPGAPLLVGYDDFAADGRPARVRIVRRTAPAGVDLVLRLAQVETGVPLDAAAVTVRVPDDAQPITLEELRRSSPLAAR